MGDTDRVTTLNGIDGDVVWSGCRVGIQNGQVVAGEDPLNFTSSVIGGTSWITVPGTTLICPATGVYAVAAMVQFSTGDANEVAFLHFTVNGVAALSGLTLYDLNNSPYLVVNLAGAVSLTAGDTIQLLLNSDGPPQAVTVVASADQSYLCINRVGGQ